MKISEAQAAYRFTLSDLSLYKVRNVNCCKQKALTTARQKNTVCYRSNIRRNGECRGIALQEVYLSSGQRGRKMPYATGVTYGETAYAVVEYRGFEPLTPTLPVLCAPNCANTPWNKHKN